MTNETDVEYINFLENQINRTRDYLRAGALLLALAIPTAYVVANPTPWSPMGETTTSQTEAPSDSPTVDLNDFDIPEGWGAAVPDSPYGVPVPVEPTQGV